MKRNPSVPTKNSNPKPLHLALPATSANLGPAFDAAALAMDFYIKIDARAAKEFSITATGRAPMVKISRKIPPTPVAAP